MFKTKRGDFAILRDGQRFVQNYWPQLIVIALLAVMAANLLAVINRKSITSDEIVHIPAGYYSLVAWDYTLNNEHPPLVKVWAALPLLFLQPNVRSTHSSSSSRLSFWTGCFAFRSCAE